MPTNTMGTYEQKGHLYKNDTATTIYPENQSNPINTPKKESNNNSKAPLSVIEGLHPLNNFLGNDDDEGVTFK